MYNMEAAAIAHSKFQTLKAQQAFYELCAKEGLDALSLDFHERCKYISNNMTDINNLFFELIRVAIGNQVCLSRTPKVKEWQELYAMAKKQSLVGICFAGVQKLVSQQQAPPKMLYLQWIAMAAKIQQRNETMNSLQPDVLKYFRDNGFHCTVLKGQGIAQLYGELAALRQSGDIDVWLNCTRKELYTLSIKEFGHLEGLTFHHIHFPKWRDAEVEAHIHPSFLSSLRRFFALKKFLKLYALKDGSADTPSLAFNRVYILLHCYQHFVRRGVGMRQIMDYYFVQSQGFSETERIESNMWIEGLGMKRFAEAMMWVMSEIFGLRDQYLLCTPNPKYGIFLLDEVMQTGNMGHNDMRVNHKLLQTAIGRYVFNLKRDIRILRVCPHEALWEPLWGVYQFIRCKCTRFRYSSKPLN